MTDEKTGDGGTSNLPPSGEIENPVTTDEKTGDGGTSSSSPSGETGNPVTTDEKTGDGGTNSSSPSGETRKIKPWKRADIYSRYPELDRERLANVLRRISDSFEPQAPPVQGQSEGFSDDAIVFFDDVMACLPADAALRLLEEEDLTRLRQRLWATEYLGDENVPLYSLDELAAHLADFISYMEGNREHLIRTGLPKWTFGPKKWLYYQLGRLYDVKKTASPWPRLTNATSTPEQLAELPAYRWIRAAAFEDASMELGHAYRYCEYGDADLLTCVKAADAQRLEASRPRLLSLKIATLRLLERALRECDSSKLWNECLSLLREHRITTDASETDFFLRMDQQYMGSDVFSDGMTDASLKMIPGGLSNLLEVVGHCEKEIDLGTLALTRQALGGIVDPDHWGRSRFRIGEEYDGQAYFWFVDRQERSTFDAALDKFLAVWSRESSFWEAYRNRVKSALPSETYEVVLVRARVLRHQVPKLKDVLEPFAGYQEDTVRRLGEPARWSPRAVAASDEAAQNQVAPGVEPRYESGDSADPQKKSAMIAEHVLISSGDRRIRLLSKGEEVWLTEDQTTLFLWFALGAARGCPTEVVAWNILNAAIAGDQDRDWAKQHPTVAKAFSELNKKLKDWATPPDSELWIGTEKGGKGGRHLNTSVKWSVDPSAELLKSLQQSVRAYNTDAREMGANTPRNEDKLPACPKRRKSKEGDEDKDV